MALTFPLSSSRLRLRPFTRHDVPSMLAVYGNEDVMRHVGYGRPASEETTEEMLRAYISHQNKYGYAFWAVVERTSGSVIGDAGLEVQPGGDVELGYTLGKPWWGKGYATEAARMCVDAAWQLQLPSLTAVVDSTNPASASVLGKLGFQLIGTVVAYDRPHNAYRLSANRS